MPEIDQFFVFFFKVGPPIRFAIATPHYLLIFQQRIRNDSVPSTTADFTVCALQTIEIQSRKIWNLNNFIVIYF
jgi:hypothetical protein